MSCVSFSGFSRTQRPVSIGDSWLSVDWLIVPIDPGLFARLAARVVRERNAPANVKTGGRVVGNVLERVHRCHDGHVAQLPAGAMAKFAALYHTRKSAKIHHPRTEPALRAKRTRARQRQVSWLSSGAELQQTGKDQQVACLDIRLRHEATSNGSRPANPILTSE